MKRRRFMQAMAAAPAVPVLIAQQAPAPGGTGRGGRGPAAGGPVLIDGKHGPQFQHPFFWSPYALVGDPSR